MVISWTKIGAIGTLIALVPATIVLFKGEPSTQNTATVNGNSNIVVQSSPGVSLPPIQPITNLNLQVTNVRGIEKETIQFLQQQSLDLNEKSKRVNNLEQEAEDLRYGLALWKFTYFRDVYPFSIAMLVDLFNLRQYSFNRVQFDQRWESKIPEASHRQYFLNEVLLKNGWAIEKDERFTISESGLSLLRQFQLIPVTSSIASFASPSFDCRKASTNVEYIICSDRDLAQADRDMLVRYKRFLSFTTHKELAIEQQRSWRRTVRDICADSDCLVRVYRDRIVELEKRIGA